MLKQRWTIASFVLDYVPRNLLEPSCGFLDRSVQMKIDVVNKHINNSGSTTVLADC